MEQGKEYVRHIAERSFPSVSCSDESATTVTWWHNTYDPCEFACGPDPEGRITIIKACPVHGMLDLSKGSGFITSTPRNSLDATVEAQVKLLGKMLGNANVDIVDGRVAFTGGLDITADEERLLRLLLSVYA